MTFKTDAEIEAFIKSHDQEIKALKLELLRLCWFMRGGITYGEILDLSVNERNIIAELVKSNLEIAKDTKMPFF